MGFSQIMVHRLLAFILACLSCCLQVVTAATAAKHGHFSVTTVKPSVCPTPTPTGALQYRTNQTTSNQLGASIALYNSTKSPIQQIVYKVTNSSHKGQVLINLSYGSRLTVTAKDGTTVQYSPGANSITIIEAGCKKARIYTNRSKGMQEELDDQLVIAHNNPEKRAGRPHVTVTVDLTDYCGYPVSSVSSPQLACTPVLYPPGQGGSNPVYGEPEYSLMDGGRKGRYVGSCTITDRLAAANNAYQDCQDAIDRKIKQTKRLDQAASGAKYFLQALSKVYAPAAEVSETILGPLGVWVALNSFLNLSPTRQQIGMESCGVPDDLSLGIQNAAFSQAIGTIVATPANTRVAAGIPTCVAGGSCSCTPACNSGGTCGCAEVDNGNSKPVCTSNLSCSAQSCNNSGDCPTGQSCLTNTCCGGGVCASPSCPNSRLASNIFAQGQEPMIFKHLSL